MLRFKELYIVEYPRKFKRSESIKIILIKKIKISYKTQVTEMTHKPKAPPWQWHHPTTIVT